ncbi:hypothetical protein [Tessaracoccus caeni]|uniref:hypothetical protein n=1 Tax=Tessaracoccus caeni TaxID=3031239 RepID=UPI0023DC75EF|nr:hypothetical protein [Tessaracoccus caeni]MDF1489833.1 hypothetical protein [Tessaracoccus caeni]
MTQSPETPDADAPQVPERLHYISATVLATAAVLSLVLFSLALYGWSAIGKEIRDQITWPQAATLLFFLLFMVGFMLSLGYSRLWAEGGVVTVRNGPVVRRYTVDQIAGLRLRQGDAWAYLLIKKDGTAQRRAVLAIQSLEGEKAQGKVRELRRWLVAQGASSEGVAAADD